MCLYGWIFFSIVILLLVVLGLPFREDDRPPTPPVAYPDGRAPSGRDVFGAAAAVLLVAIVGPLIAAGFDRAERGGAAADPPTLRLPACAQTAPAERSLSAAPGRVLIQHLACDARGVTVRLELFSPRTAPGALVTEERRLVGLSGDLSLSKVLVVHGVSWRLIQTEEPVLHRRQRAVDERSAGRRRTAHAPHAGLGEPRRQPSPHPW